MRISLAAVVLGTVGLLGIREGVRVLGLPVFVPEPLGSGSYLIGLSTLFLLAIGAETVLHPAPRTTAPRATPRRLLSLVRDPEIQAWLALVLYAGLLNVAGYFLPTLAYLLVSIRLFGERRWVRGVAIASALALIYYVVFEKLAGIPLP